MHFGMSLSLVASRESPQADLTRERLLSGVSSIRLRVVFWDWNNLVVHFVLKKKFIQKIGIKQTYLLWVVR